MHSATAALNARRASLVENEDYTQALTGSCRRTREVDYFFDQVRSMTDEPLIRAIRWHWLAQLAVAESGGRHLRSCHMTERRGRREAKSGERRRSRIIRQMQSLPRLCIPPGATTHSSSLPPSLLP